MLLGDKLIETIARKTLGSIIDPNSDDQKKFSRQGEIDGRVDEPPQNQIDFGKTERDYIDQVSERWRLFNNNLFYERQKLLREQAELTHKLNVSLKSEEDLISNEQKKEIDLLDIESGQHSPAYKNLQEIFNSAQDQLNDIKSHLNRPLDIKFTNTYVFLMIILSIAEIPVNRLAFELFFESMPAVSLLLSAAVGILFIFFAHIVGTQFKRSQCPLTALNKEKTYIAIILITASALLIMYFLGLMREQLVETQAASSIDLAELLAESSNPSLDNVTNFNFQIGGKGVFLVIINFSIFLSGVLLAFFRHDSNPYYEEFTKLYDIAKNNLNNHIKEHEKRYVDLLRGFKDRLNRNNNLRFELEKNLERIKNTLFNIENQGQVYREKVLIEMELSIRAYRNANKQSRKTEAPRYFSDPLDKILGDLIK